MNPPWKEGDWNQIVTRLIWPCKKSYNCRMYIVKVQNRCVHLRNGWDHDIFSLSLNLMMASLVHTPCLMNISLCSIFSIPFPSLRLFEIKAVKPSHMRKYLQVIWCIVKVHFAHYSLLKKSPACALTSCFKAPPPPFTSYIGSSQSD